MGSGVECRESGGKRGHGAVKGGANKGSRRDIEGGPVSTAAGVPVSASCCTAVSPHPVGKGAKHSAAAADVQRHSRAALRCAAATQSDHTCSRSSQSACIHPAATPPSLTPTHPATHPATQPPTLALNSPHPTMHDSPAGLSWSGCHQAAAPAVLPAGTAYQQTLTTQAGHGRLPAASCLLAVPAAVAAVALAVAAVPAAGCLGRARPAAAADPAVWHGIACCGSCTGCCCCCGCCWGCA